MKLRIGILGKANIAIRSIIPTLQSLQEYFEIVAIATRKKGATELSHEGIPIIEGYDNLLKIKELNAIYIPLPNSLHYPWIKKALDLNINVWVEKSLACTLAETEELVEKARSKKLVLLESFQFRFHKQIYKIKDLLQESVVGEVRSFRSSFGFPPFHDKNNIRYQPELGGGALLDAGAYTIKASQLFLGKNLRVASAQWCINSEFEVDLWGNGMLISEDGLKVAHLSFGFDNFYQCGIEIWGSTGKLFTNRLFTAKKGFIPSARIETADGVREVELPEDDAFRNIAIHFHHLTTHRNYEDMEYENQNNIEQARLIEEFRKTAKQCRKYL